ncbi:MAG: GNAT family N-acetyltransferase [Halobacteriovoraceae bacterium]|jgi:predicted N-acetyltransferase YhbS|nr:GNAT family N-acetyltransferase [Halobacteriovoraceae bacterium]
MKLTNLKDSPEFVEKTIKLIEQEFEYDEVNSFAIDFYPLMQKSNHHNNFIYIAEDEVIAHIGVLEKEFILNGITYPFSMYGGIAVSKKHQGQGIFKSLFNEVINKFTNKCFHLLWSEKVDLYKKFGFFPCLELNEYKKESFQHSFDVIQTTLSNLSEDDYMMVKSLYISSKELRVSRSESDWKNLKPIDSTDLFLIKNNSKIINYFFMNKGQDLTHIIHEYGFMNDEQLQLLRHYANVWTPYLSDTNKTNLYATMLRPGEKSLFTSFIQNYLAIEILDINENITFKYQENSYEQSINDFLIGAFGPGRFKEITSPYLFISGLDSI